MQHWEEGAARMWEAARGAVRPGGRGGGERGRRQCVCRVTRLFGGALAAVHDVAAGASLPARATALQAVMADERLAPGQAWLGLGLGLGL